MEPDSSASIDEESKAHQQRMDAIRSLAVAHTQTPAATHEQRRQEIGRTLLTSHGGRRRMLIWGGSLSLAGIVIAIILVSALRGATSTARPTARSLEVIRFLQSHLTCPRSASWSPDGKELAVVGYAVCDSQDVGAQGTHPLVALYNATSGREAAVLPLESALVRDATHGAALDAYQLQLGSPVWTDDGQTIGVSFTLAPAANPDQVIYGLAVLRDTGSATAIIPATPLIRAEITFQTYSRYTSVPPLVARFDIANGSASAIAPPPSLLYQWDAQGTLVPTTHPSAHARTLPASMSGSISYVCSSSGDASAPGNHAYYWISAGGSAWSPDDRYFFSTLGAYGRLAGFPPATSQPAAGSQRACDVAGPPSKWPIVTMPVGGLDSAERGLDPYNITELEFVTSPGGSRVAVSEQAASTEQTVSVYDTATGRLLARFDAPQLLKQAHVTTDQGGILFPTMSWSPGVDSLALLDTGDRALIILGPADLRQAGASDK